MPEQETPDQGGGDEFKPITSQEDLDRIIGKRVERERSKFADYDELKTKATEFDKVSEASKTELQKAMDRAEAAEKRAAGYEAEKQRADWAREITKDSPVPAHLLRGSTREELEQHFADLSEAIKAAEPPKPQRKATPPGKASSENDGVGRAAAAVRALRHG